MPIVAKIVWVVTYRKKLPSVNSHDPSIRWSCEVMPQIKVSGSPCDDHNLPSIVR